MTVRFYVKGATKTIEAILKKFRVKADFVNPSQKEQVSEEDNQSKERYLSFKIDELFLGFVKEFISQEFLDAMEAYIVKITIKETNFFLGKFSPIPFIFGDLKIAVHENTVMIEGPYLPEMFELYEDFLREHGDVKILNELYSKKRSEVLALSVVKDEKLPEEKVIVPIPDPEKKSSDLDKNDIFLSIKHGTEEEKKKNPFARIGDWWNNL